MLSAICALNAPCAYSPALVMVYDRIVIAIREHVATEEALAGGGEGVCIDKSMDDGVVIAALEVIPSRFCLLLVPVE